MKASACFIAAVNDLSRSGLNWQEAWQRTSILHPDLATLVRAAGASPDRVLAWNSRAGQMTRYHKVNRARDKFAILVSDRMRQTGEGYNDAWIYCMRENSTAYNEIVPPQLQSASAAAPTPKLFLLPEDATPNEIAIAFRANGNKTEPLNPGRVAEALVSYMAELAGTDMKFVMEGARQKYQKLFEAVDQVASEAKMAAAMKKVMTNL